MGCSILKNGFLVAGLRLGLFATLVLLATPINARYQHENQFVTPDTLLDEAQAHLNILPEKSLSLLFSHPKLLSLSPDLTVKWYNTQAIAAIRTGELTPLYTALLALSEAQSSPDFLTYQSHVFNHLGVWMRRSGYLHDARSSYVCSIQHSSSEQEKLRGILNLGVVERNLGNVETARQLNVEAQKLAAALELDAYLAVIENNLGIISIAQSKYDDAQRYFSNALEMNQYLDRRSGELLAANNLLLTFLLQQRYDLFERLTTRVRRMLRLSPDSPRLAYYTVLNNVFLLQNTDENTDSTALQLRTKVLDNYLQLNDKGIQALLRPLLKENDIPLPEIDISLDKKYPGTLLSSFHQCDWQKFSDEFDIAMVKSVLDQNTVTK